MAWAIMARTPLAVWLVLAVLVVLGYFQSKPRTRSLGRVAVVPIVMAGVSLVGVYYAFGASFLALAAWLVGAAIAVVMNETLILARGTRYSPDTRTFDIPGSWLPLGVMLAIFCTWYAFAVFKLFHPDAPYRLEWLAGVGVVQGFLSGIFFGSLVRMYRIARRSVNRSY